MSSVSDHPAGARARAATGSRALRYLVTLGVAMRARLPAGGYVRGLLSVVVPAHNVERYIDEFLHSVRRQGYPNIEVIVVDDGSTDDSVRIAERHRRRDPRLRIVRRANGGPSAARNTGVAAARGEFLTFLDPDDIVRADAYRLAVATLLETGSDFAVLSYDRLENGRRRRPGSWISAAHATRRHRCTVDSAPDIQVNAVVWSKVFRRSFYDAAGLRFPEGAIYEDQPVSARAYAQAQAFDVLPYVAVSWRVREDGTSITQQTSRADNIAAHNEAVRASLAELEDAGHPSAAAARALQLLANNMRLFSRHIDVADDKFWATLRVGLQELMQRVSAEAYIREVPAQEKVLNELILRDDRTRAEQFLSAGGMSLESFPTEQAADGNFVARLPFFGDQDADLPADRYVLADRQLSMNAMVTGHRWEGQATMVVEGWAHIRNVDLAARAPEIGIHAIDPSGRRIGLRTAQRFAELPDEVNALDRCDYRNGGFTAWLDLADLDKADGPWRLEVEVAVPGLARVGPLARMASTEAATGSTPRLSDEPTGYVAGPLEGGDFGLRRANFHGQMSGSGSRTP